MAGLKLTRFQGVFPKQSPELLPDFAAQIARNVKIDSGDLIPYPAGVVRANSGYIGEVRTLFALRNPSTNAPVWLSWLTDVDVAVITDVGETEQRFYFTGDGVPKVSNYRLGVGAFLPPWPVQSFDLGLPLPPDDEVVIATIQPFTTKTTASVARDATGLVTLVTTTPHELRTGQRITVTGFTFLSGTYSRSGSTVTVTMFGHGIANGETVGLDFVSGAATDGFYLVTVVDANTFTVSDPVSGTTSGSVRLTMASFNSPGIEVVVVNSTTITYPSPGPITSTISTGDGRVDIGGLPQVRTYVFTWVTPWEEESVASRPSVTQLVREGTRMLLTGLPVSKPPGNNFVRGIRVYRTLPSLSGNDYFRLQTFWFPTRVQSANRVGSLVTITLEQPHNKGAGERFRFDNPVDPTESIDTEVVSIVDEYTFTYANGGPSGLLAVGSVGMIYSDVAQTASDTARYWGFAGDYSFVDDFDSVLLSRRLGSDNYDPPPPDLKGIIAIANATLAGFSGNTIYFSEPGAPHAWPREYAISLEHRIVAIRFFAGGVFVATEKYPYFISGSDPRIMQAARIEANYPCLSARGVVLTNTGILYPTHDGLAQFAIGNTTLLTRIMYTDDTWKELLDPTSIRAVYYGDGYLAAHSNGGFRFEPLAEGGGSFVNLDLAFTAAFYEPLAGKAFYASGTTGDIFEWDALDQPPTRFEWKSKALITRDMLNIGAARVIADYGAPSVTWDDASATWVATPLDWIASGDLVFRLWVDKTLIAERVVSDDKPFRLPTGYRADTFEVGVEGDVRVRALHMAETVYGLREV